MSQFRERSPVRGRPPVRAGEAEVGQVTYLGQGDINAARAALGSAVASALNRWNSTMVGSNTRLLPPGPTERNTEFYIFPLMYDKMASPSDFEQFLNSELAEALDGRRARLSSENNFNGHISWFITVPVSRPELEKPKADKESGRCVAFIYACLLLFLAVNLAGFAQRHFGSIAEQVLEL